MALFFGKQLKRLIPGVLPDFEKINLKDEDLKLFYHQVF